MSDPTQPFFTRYTRLVTETDLVAAMREQGPAIAKLLGSVSSFEASRLHGKYTWTIKQVIGHITDAERVFGYRAMRFARNDATPLPGFDENAYAENSNANDRKMADLVAEFATLRQSHVLFFMSLPTAAWLRIGTASNLTWSVTDIAKAIIGHARHHETIIRQRLENAA